jgi:hypothetical protein
MDAVSKNGNGMESSEGQFFDKHTFTVKPRGLLKIRRWAWVRIPV